MGRRVQLFRPFLFGVLALGLIFDHFRPGRRQTQHSIYSNIRIKLACSSALLPQPFLYSLPCFASWNLKGKITVPW